MLGLRAIVVLAGVLPLGLVPVAGATPPSPTDPPVPLLEESPWAPAGAAAAGVDPTASVVIHLDDRGKPCAVEVVRVDPSSPYDAAFVQAARDSILRWRFAPALRDGRRVESTVERQVRFRPPAPGGLGPPSRSRSVPDVSELDAGEKSLWRYVLSLSMPQRTELRDKLAGFADRRLSTLHRSRATTDRFEVATDVPGEDIASRIAHNLEASFGATNGLLASQVPPQPTQGRILVYVFSTQAAYRDLAQESHAPGGSEGFYHPVGLLAFHAELGANEVLTHVLLHEGVHAFLEAHVLRPGVTLPLWLDEGLAEYVANSDIKNGRVVPGSHSKRTTYRNAYVTWRGQSLATLDAGELKKAIRTGKAPSLPALVAAGSKEFYGEGAALYYSEAWLFVHFLRHGRPEWAGDAFPRFVLYLAEGFEAGESFVTVYGRPVADFAAEFQAYVKSF